MVLPDVQLEHDVGQLAHPLEAALAEEKEDHVKAAANAASIGMVSSRFLPVMTILAPDTPSDVNFGPFLELGTVLLRSST